MAVAVDVVKLTAVFAVCGVDAPYTNCWLVRRRDASVPTAAHVGGSSLPGEVPAHFEGAR
jgi:hypothetical protein